jgi:hypothetical protein
MLNTQPADVAEGQSNNPLLDQPSTFHLHIRVTAKFFWLLDDFKYGGQLKNRN